MSTLVNEYVIEQLDNTVSYIEKSKDKSRYLV